MGTRIGRSIAKASVVSAPKPAKHDKTTLDMPIEKIVRDNVLKVERKETSKIRIAQQTMMSSTLLSASTAARVLPEILGMLRTEMEKYEGHALQQMCVVLQMSRKQQN